MLKTGHRGLLESLANFFNEVLNGVGVPPAAWKATKIKVCFFLGVPGATEKPQSYFDCPSVVRILQHSPVHKNRRSGGAKDIRRPVWLQKRSRLCRACALNGSGEVGGVGASALDGGPRSRKVVRPSASCRFVPNFT